MPARRVVGRERARRGRELLFGGLGVDAELHRVALDFHVVLREVEFLAGGDAQLPLHHVETCHFLGDGVFDLNARVDLHEVELAVLDEELHGAGVGVVGGADTAAGSLADALAQVVGERRRRGLLDDLLVAALERTVALAEVADVAVLVGENLHLDVARRFEVLFDVDGGVVEVRLALALCRLELLVDLVLGVDDLQAAAAAAAFGLDGDRVAELVGDGLDVVGGVGRLGRAGDDRYVSVLHERAGLRLLAEALHGVGRRADPLELGLLDLPGERGVLREEAVAGVDGVGGRPFARPR